MIINLLNRNSARVIILFSTSPGRKYLRKEIREKTEINNVPLDASLAELANLKIIVKKGKIYSLNLENNLVSQILEELKEVSYIPLKIRFMLNDFIFYASKIRGIKEIILFGSYAKLIFSDKSDIDTAIICDPKSEIEKKAVPIADKLSKKYKKNIHINFLSEQDLRNKKDPLIRDILRNGKRLV